MYAKLIQVATAEGTEHENTVTEGSIYRKTFAANELQVGQVYKMVVPIIVNDNNSTDTLTTAVRFGTSTTVTSNTACGTSAAIDSADADAGLVEAYLEVHSATRAICYGWIAAPDAANVEKASSFGPTVLTLDATVANYWDVTLDWSVAHADNEAAAAGGHVALVS